jgi:hypothetical protein
MLLESIKDKMKTLPADKSSTQVWQFLHDFDSNSISSLDEFS